jgi:predicted short-subunit dehydrogenase-like oxidoreductase (DUF2520 family)
VNTIARKFKIKKALKPEELIAHDGLYIMAVNDDEIASAFNQWYNGRGTWVHTSGSTDLKIFGKKSGSFGVLYPLISLTSGGGLPPSFIRIPYLLEASDRKTLNKLKAFVKRTRGECWVFDSTKRLKVHLAAVFMNNFIQHLGIIAYRMIKDLRLRPDIMKALALITMVNVMNNEREKLQTGPARRKDFKTIRKHEKLLKNNPEIKAIYRVMTNSIIKMYS